MGNKLPLILGLVNVLVLIAAAGLLYYTRMVFKRPVITESGERARLAKLHESPLPPTIPMTINFDPITVNIESTPKSPKVDEASSQQIQGKLHYVTLGFALEIRDSKRQEDIEELRPFLIDHLLHVLGHKKFQDLNSVQGRYILKTEIVNFANEYIAKHKLKGLSKPPEAEKDPSGVDASADGTEPNSPPKDILVTELYFNQFVTQ
jgi:flagellar basal body-associated protein FliL